VAGSCTGGAVPPKLVFITETSVASTFQGAPAADAICNQEAAAAGLAGTYRAWLGEDDLSSMVLRVAQSESGYVRTDGTSIADNYADLVDGTLDAPINVTALGATVSEVQAWSNQHVGAPVPFLGAASCAGWTTTASTSYGWTGLADETDSAWTEGQILPCSPYRLARFYCFQD
jgi:hypothetical protein